MPTFHLAFRTAGGASPALIDAASGQPPTTPAPLTAPSRLAVRTAANGPALVSVQVDPSTLTPPPNPKHARRSRQYITYPPPHSAHCVRPEKRYFGRRAWLNRFGSPLDVTRRISSWRADPRPAAESAAGCGREAADRQEDKASVIVQRGDAILYSAKQSGCEPGNGAPEFSFPHPVPL